MVPGAFNFYCQTKVKMSTTHTLSITEIQVLVYLNEKKDSPSYILFKKNNYSP